MTCKLLSDLSRYGWEALKLYFKKAVKGKEAVPGAVIAIQSFGDFLGFNPYLHVLISDGCFHENGRFSFYMPLIPELWSKSSGTWS